MLAPEDGDFFPFAVGKVVPSHRITLMAVKASEKERASFLPTARDGDPSETSSYPKGAKKGPKVLFAGAQLL